MPNATIKKIKSALKAKTGPSKKQLLFIVPAVLLVFVTLLLLQNWVSDPVGKNATSSQNIERVLDFSVNGTNFAVEVAESDSQKAKGLSGRTNLDASAGMLFVYQTSGDYGFWMKDTLIPLDMLWLDANKKIVHIESNVQPSSYPETFNSPTPAQYILELGGGVAEKNGLKVGQVAEFNL